MSKPIDTPNDKPKKKVKKSPPTLETADGQPEKPKAKRSGKKSKQVEILDPNELNPAEQALEQPQAVVSSAEDTQAEAAMDQELDSKDDLAWDDASNFDDNPELNQNPRDIYAMESDEELLNRVAGVYQIWWNWAHFELSIITPSIEPFDACVIIPPEALTDAETEFVYPISDYGNRLATSKAAEMYSVGTSMCKLYYTIEKMIYILIERIKTGDPSSETEIQIAFDGHQLAQRKAFESVINLSQNVVVTNFDPGSWGERYLDVVKRLAEKGYGYPPEAPRDFYRNPSRTSVGAKR